MTKGYQVIKFVILDFDANWDRTMLVTGYANIRYTAINKGGKLAVVFEDTNGMMSTYRYQIPAKEEVYVVDQVIHVPERYLKKEANNTILSAG